MTTQLAIRIADDQLAQIDAMVPQVHESRTELIRRAIELYLYRIACEKDARIYESMPLTEAEMSQFEGPADWDQAPAW